METMVILMPGLNESNLWYRFLIRTIALHVLLDGHTHRWFHLPSDGILIPVECIAWENETYKSLPLLSLFVNIKP